MLDIAICAHNEAGGIAVTLRDCLGQSIFLDPTCDVRLFVLANGCEDATAEVARLSLERSNASFEVLDYTEGGKSRTLNQFIHTVSRPQADYFLFCDVDIRLPDPTTFEKLLRKIRADDLLAAVPSRPVKDLRVQGERLSLVEKLILAGGDGLDDWKHVICGQLYVARATVMRSFWLPVGLPVEDGFIRAMIVTNNFERPENLARIEGEDSCYHIYSSERSLHSLIRHQCRIVIGSAINFLIFERLLKEAAENRSALTEAAAKDPNWLPTLIRARLPKAHGWIPGHFLVKRITNLRSGDRLTAQRLAKALMGFSFDAVVYVLAQAKMARGAGANYW